MSITEEKKKKRRTTVIRKTYPDWYPWVSLGLGGYGASGEQSPAPVEFTGTITGSGGGGEGGAGGAMGESVQALFQAPNYHKCLMIPRANMPQIATADIPDFLSSLPGSTSLAYLDPNELAPSQGEFDMEKVNCMSPGAAQMPIMVSKDGYVVDGHHRWLANAKMGLRQPAYVLPLSAKVCLQMMDKHPASFNKGINEHIEKYFGGAVVASRMSRMHEAAMSEEDNAHFRAYTMNARYVNDALKSRKQDIQSGIVIPFGSKPDEKHAAAISESISKMPALNRDMTVYTGTSEFVHPGIIQKFSNGVFHHPSFISTSPSIDVAKRFTSDKGGARHILKLDLPAGFNKGAFMEAHSSHNESEYLIDHNQMLGISHKVDDIQDHEGRPVEVWQAHILSPEEAAERANGNEYAQAEIEAHRAFGARTFTESVENWYHGTEHPYKEIDTSKLSSGYDRLGPGFYLTSDTADAHAYATAQHRRQDSENSSPNILAVNSHVKNPIDVLRTHSLDDNHVRQIIKMGHPNMPDHEVEHHLETSKDPEDSMEHATHSRLNKPVVNQINYLHRAVYGRERTGEFLSNVHKVTGHDGMIDHEPKYADSNYENGEPVHLSSWFPDRHVKMKWGGNNPDKPGLMEGSFEKKREEFVKTLKKKKSEFVDKYGEDWENVLYGTATNMAKKATS